MDGKSFRRLCETVGSLTGPQLKDLRAALRSLDARMQAIGAIEKRREGAVAWDLVAVNLITTLKAIQQFGLNIEDLPLMAMLEDGSTISGFSLGDQITVNAPANDAFDVDVDGDVDGDADGFMDFIVDVDMDAVFSNLTTLGLDMDLFTGLLRFDVAVTSDFASDLPEFSLFDPNGDDDGFLFAETTSLISDVPIATLFDEDRRLELRRNGFRLRYRMSLPRGLKRQQGAVQYKPAKSLRKCPMRRVSG